MDYDALVTFAQEHFTDGLALVIGSGLSAAEGIPGMSALATHLSNGAGLLTETAATLWYQIKAVLDAGGGLEAALLEHAQPLNLDRMRAATAGGTWRNWDDNRLTFKRRFGESACLPSEVLNGFGGVLRLRGVHANEPDGVALALNPNLDGISINHSLDVGGNWIKLGAGNQAHESADKHGESGHLGPEWKGQGQAPSSLIV